MVSTQMKAVVKTGVDKVELRTVNVPEPGPGQVLVKIFAAAQTPSDWYKLKGEWVEGPDLVVGHDFAGVIQQLGPNVEARKVGQRVAGFLDACVSAEYGGTFAEYCVVDAAMLVEIPDTMSFESASTLGLNAFTACQVLWQNQKLPTPLEPAKESFPILVWGGATSVGQYVIQLAKQSGLQVITTASLQNHDLIKKLGADAVFDYRDVEVVSKIKSFSGDKELTVAIDCVSVVGSVDLVSECLGDREGSYIALVLPVEVQGKNINSDFTYVYTLFGKATLGRYSYPAIAEHYELGKWSAKLLSQLAKKGTITTNPVRVVPNGLADAQYWIKYQEQGKVRAERIVYSICSD